MSYSNIKLSRQKGKVPLASTFSFNELVWNIADGILYAKALNDSGGEIVIAIGGSPIAGINPHTLIDFSSIVQDKHFVYPISHQSFVVIQHNLGKEPAVSLRDELGNYCICDHKNIDLNTTEISTAEPFTGLAIFN